MNTDILSHLFETIIDANSSSLSIIRSVSREWFETARDTPKLWSKIILNRRIQFTNPEYVSLHLRHSGRTPLNITITLPEDLPYDADMPAIDQLRKAVHKFKSLTIDGPFFEAWQTLVSRIGEGQPAPLLERLVLKVKGDVNDEKNSVPFTTLSTALTPSPNLTYLQLPAWPLPAHPPPHLTNVTSLTFDTPYDPFDIIALYKLIQATPHLLNFTFKSDDYGLFPDLNFSNPISVPQLRSVHITAAGYVADILSNLHAPFLTDVYLHGGRGDAPDANDESNEQGSYGTDANFIYGEEDRAFTITWATPQILSYLAAHSPNIRRLELHHILFELPEAAFKIILGGKALPALAELILNMTNISNDALIENAMAPSSLRTLTLHNCRYISMGGLGPFIRGRVNAEFLLNVKGCRKIRRRDIESLSEIVHVVQD